MYPRSDIFEFPATDEETRELVRNIAGSFGAEVVEDRMLNGVREMKVTFPNDSADGWFSKMCDVKPTRRNV
jgi:hypothetical protein